jgi:hypothetical protein
MKTLLLTTALAVTFTGTASATDWYILRGDTKQCIAAKALAGRPGLDAFASPAMLEQSNRETGTFKDTMVKRDSDGKIVMVYVELRTTGVVYFPGKDECNIVRSASLQNGTLTDPNELR